MILAKQVLTFFAILAIVGSAVAQTGAGTVTGVVTDPTGAFVQTEVVLDTVPIGDRKLTRTDDSGRFEFRDVPFGIYVLRIEEPGFQPVVRQVGVHSALPVEQEISLQVGAPTESVTVEAEVIDRASSRSETAISQNAIVRRPAAARNEMQSLVATTPGWTTENDGLLHIRGVDDGILYIVDGIPNPDRVDAQSSVSPETEAISSAKVITGNIPAEFGDRSGAVVVVQQKSGLGQPLQGTVATGVGSFRSGELSATAGGGTRKFGYLFSGSSDRSNRFLDPVDPRAFHDRGGEAELSGRFDWHPTNNDVLLFHLSGNGSDFRVPNNFVQQLAGQDQRQELRSDGQSISWQHTWSPATLSNVALFRNFYRSQLTGSAFDAPLFASANRHHVRQGLMASSTHSVRGHLLKAGVQATRVSVNESFSFAVTDPEAAADQLSPAALAFTAANPFVFRDHRVPGSTAGYVQDDFSPFPNLTVNAGVRFDHTSLLVSDHQLSPRIGTVYYVPATKTAFRASFNRLYMPPQVENLLLASSEQVRRLSPFPGGGAPVLPEKSSAFEAGVSQQLPGMLSLKLAYWWRYFRNIDDPNVFFSSTIVFPNSVAQARAKGLDARLEIADRKGWSGYISYTNSRITEIGPLNGGLFLTNDFIEIGPGTEFTPDHDQRNVGAAGVTYNHPRHGFWASFSGRYESGVPIEVSEDELDRLRLLPGADLVNFARQRVKPWGVVATSAGIDLLRRERVTVSLQGDIQNLADRSFVYNFGNPFAGTHFGYPRTWSGRLRFSFH